MTDVKGTGSGMGMTRNGVRVAVVGAGAMAREHIRAFADVPGVSVAGIHSRTRARAQTLAADFAIPTVSDDVAGLYDATRADLVVVAVTEPSMAAVAGACFAHPWGVLLEKPAGVDLADAIGIARAAERASARVWVALNRRHLASTRAALADLADDPAPRFIRIQDQEDQSAARAGGQPETVVRNWMYANAIHMVDYARIFGRGSIIGVERIAPWDPAAPAVVLARILFSSGDQALYEAIWNGPGPWSCAVSTPRRRWEMRPLEKAVYQNAGERTHHPIDPDPLDDAFKPGFRRQAEAAVRAVRGEAAAIPTLADSLLTMRLIADIYDANGTDRPWTAS